MPVPGPDPGIGPGIRELGRSAFPVRGHRRTLANHFFEPAIAVKDAALPRRLRRWLEEPSLTAMAGSKEARQAIDGAVLLDVCRRRRRVRTSYCGPIRLAAQSATVSAGGLG